MEMYEIIRSLRESLNMSQDELAAKSGYSDRSSIAKIETGKVDLTCSKIKAIATALNTTPDVLIGISPAPARSSEHDQLIAAYDQLNDAGKEAALSYLSYLGQQPIYKNDHQFGMGKKRSGSVT